MLPTEETIAASEPAPGPEPAPEREPEMATSLAQEARAAMAAPDEEEDAPDADSVFAKLKQLKSE